MRKVKWGIISTAKIGTQKVIPGMLRAKHAEVVAIASRNMDDAAKAAKTLGIAKAYGSYEALLDDKEIEAVYIPLPNHMHVPWTMKAMQAGKHVLCEKPIALDASEAAAIMSFSKLYPQLKLMEAFMYRHHPQWAFVKQYVSEGNIGMLKNIHSIFSYYNIDPENIRNKPGIGGGGLMDIGCYCISFARWLFDKEPHRVSGIIDTDPVMQTDRYASAILDFETGTSLFTCSTQLTPFQRIHIVGTEAAIEIEIPVNAPPDKPTKLWIYRNGKKEERIFDMADQYTLQCESFSQSIINNTPVTTPIEDAVANMKVIDAIFQSSSSNTWITL